MSAIHREISITILSVLHPIVRGPRSVAPFDKGSITSPGSHAQGFLTDGSITMTTSFRGPRNHLAPKRIAWASNHRRGSRHKTVNGNYSPSRLNNNDEHELPAPLAHSFPLSWKKVVRPAGAPCTHVTLTLKVSRGHWSPGDLQRIALSAAWTWTPRADVSYLLVRVMCPLTWRGLCNQC